MALGLTCEVGKRQRTFHILSGSVLSVWSKLETVLAGQPGANSKVQIVRCRKSDGSRIVGEPAVIVVTHLGGNPIWKRWRCSSSRLGVSIESIRFWDEDDYENEIFSILSSARAWTSPILAGKRDSCYHSTTGFIENVVVAKTSYQK